ncbi:hypothetical protein [Streptomyces sp. MMG1121]|uniref:hypothetical protein n=1 Tax=Streptomyces sp. MMG1121 TaxID=1415544 RepID=UPI0006ADDDB4|nr:hypothetical protein [Streptomyces sp. MMG1121]KOV58321.1 hypothetical protein ADK64_36385 [Streptomyces sp. MMG1121]
MRKFLGPLLCTTAGALARPAAPPSPEARARDRLTLSSEPRRTPVALDAAVNPADDVSKSTICAPGDVLARRISAYANTLGYGSDVCDLGPALPGGGDPPGRRLVSQPDAARAGVPSAAVDAQV